MDFLVTLRLYDFTNSAWLNATLSPNFVNSSTGTVQMLWNIMNFTGGALSPNNGGGGPITFIQYSGGALSISMNVTQVSWD